MKKLCRCCQKMLDMDCYHLNNKAQDKRQNICKTCKKEYSKLRIIGIKPPKLIKRNPVVLDLDNPDVVQRLKYLIDGVNTCYDYMDDNPHHHKTNKAQMENISNHLLSFIQEKFGKIEDEAKLDRLPTDKPRLNHEGEIWSDWLDSGNPNWYNEPD